MRVFVAEADPFDTSSSDPASSPGRNDHGARFEHWEIHADDPHGILRDLLGALLFGLTDMSAGGVILIAVAILAIGLVGVWMLDRRRKVA